MTTEQRTDWALFIFIVGILLIAFIIGFIGYHYGYERGYEKGYMLSLNIGSFECGQEYVDEPRNNTILDCECNCEYNKTYETIRNW